MAVTGIFDNNLTAPKKDTSKFSTLSNNLNGGLFSNIKTGENKTGDAVVSNVNDMLSGNSYDAYKAQANQKLSRAIANLRNSVGTQYGGSVGQGSYNKALQGAEQSIFSQMADNNLQADVEKNAMKERGITAAQNLAQAEATNSQNNMQTAMASDTAYGYTDQFGNKIRGSNELAGKQVDIQQQQTNTTRDLGYANIASTEKVAGMNISSSEKISANQLNESARQFNITNDTDKQQFAATLQKDYATLSQQEKQFLMNYGLDRDKFNQAKSEFTQNIALEQQKLLSNEKIATAQLGLDRDKFNQAKSEFTQNIALEQQKLLSNEKIATAQLGLDAQKLAETARQFNISTSEAAKQFTDKLNFDYTSLSQNDKQFLANLGLDQAKFEESKRQYNNTTALEDKWRTKDLDLKEQSLAQEASQFTDRLSFDKWATQAGLDDAAANRIWQATQNDKALENTKYIATMQNDTEVWKQNKVAELTRAGWDVETARANADREQNLTIANMQNALTRDVESGRITQAQAELAQQASQFTTQQAWTEKATQLGIDQENAKMAWTTNERVASEAFTATQNTYQGQLQKDLAAGQWTDEKGQVVESAQRIQLMEQLKLAKAEVTGVLDGKDTLAMQQLGLQRDALTGKIKDSAGNEVSTLEAERLAMEKKLTETQMVDPKTGQLMFNADGSKKMIDINTARNMIETQDRIETNINNLNMQTLQNNFTEKGWNFEGIYNYLQSLDPQNAAKMIQDMAEAADITHTVVGSNGEAIEVPGFENFSQKAYDTNKSLNANFANGVVPNQNVSKSEVSNLTSGWDTYVEKYPNLFVSADQGLESFNTVSWNKNSDSWKISGEANTWLNNNVGKLVKGANGSVYQVAGKGGSTDRNGTSYIMLRDITNGNIVKYSSGPGSSQKFNYVQ